MVMQVSELDRDSGVPLGTQLAWILRSRVASGEFAPGERLPGAKELAALAGVNVNTVRAVFAKLADEGVLHVIHGKGTFVSEEPQLGDDGVASLAAMVSAEARRRGVDPREVAAALYARPAAPPATEPAAVLRRRVLREEIAGLEGELAELQASHPELAGGTGATDFAGARLLETAELERTRDALAARLDEVRTEVSAALQNVREQRRLNAEPGSARDSQTTTAPARFRVSFEA